MRDCKAALLKKSTRIVKSRGSNPRPTTTRSRDRKDDYLLELAIAANVDVLISGDHDLTDLTDPGVLVRTPHDFLTSMGTT